MSSIATAIVGSAVIGGIASSRAASEGAKATRQATDQQVAESQRQYDQTREDFAPWREMGLDAMQRLEDPLANFYASPDYEFRMTEGLDQLGAQFGMKGGGGNAMRGLEAFRQGMAGGAFNDWRNFTMGQVESGRGANTNMAAMGQNSSNAIVNAYGNQGANLANIYANKYANINNAAQSGISNMLYAAKAGIGPWKP